jgi:hypothetical protein
MEDNLELFVFYYDKDPTFVKRKEDN